MARVLLDLLGVVSPRGVHNHKGRMWKEVSCVELCVYGRERKGLFISVCEERSFCCIL